MLFRYQGQYLDSETDLCYNRYRYYDPSIGTYISQDPIGLAGNNPTLYGYISDANSEVDVFGLNIFDYLRNGGLTFDEYKVLRGETRTLDFIETTNKAGKKVLQRISTEYHHVFIPQCLQRRFNLPNWLINNRLNVWKLNTIQHSILDKFRFRFLRDGLKKDVGWFKKYNFFTRFGKGKGCH